jgi:hypothetical protein
MLKTYIGIATGRICTGSQQIIDVVVGDNYLLEDRYARGFTTYLTETADWKSLESGIAVELVDVEKSYDITEIKGKKDITLTITPTGLVPSGFIIDLILTNLSGTTLETASFETVARLSEATDFTIKLNKPYENYNLNILLTFPLGDAYSADVDIDITDSEDLDDVLYKVDGNKYVISIIPTLS